MNVSSTISVEVDFSEESHDMILGPKIDSLTENISLGLHYRDHSTEDLSACITFRDIQSALNDGDEERPKNQAVFFRNMTVMCKINRIQIQYFLCLNPVLTDAKYKKIVLNHSCKKIEIFGLESKIHISQLTIYTNHVSKCVSSRFSDMHVKVKLE